MSMSVLTSITVQTCVCVCVCSQCVCLRLDISKLFSLGQEKDMRIIQKRVEHMKQQLKKREGKKVEERE